VCQGFLIFGGAGGGDTTGCLCAPPTSSCDTDAPNVCPGFGLCPAGMVCGALVVESQSYCDCF
jgi:hypothetical protein